MAWIVYFGIGLLLAPIFAVVVLFIDPDIFNEDDPADWAIAAGWGLIMGAVWPLSAAFGLIYGATRLIWRVAQRR